METAWMHNGIHQAVMAPAPVGAMELLSPGSADRTNSEDAVQVARAVDSFFDLTRESRTFPPTAELGADDRTSFVKMLATLLHQGVIGYDRLRVNGESYTSHLPAGLADPRLREAPLDRRRLDVRG